MQSRGEKGQAAAAQGLWGKAHVGWGREVSGTGTRKRLGRGREGAGMSGAGGWKVSLFWGGLERLQKLFGGAR